MPPAVGGTPFRDILFLIGSLPLSLWGHAIFSIKPIHINHGWLRISVDLFLRSLLFLLHSPLFCSGNFALHKNACLLPPTYKFCTYYGTKSVLSSCRFFVIFTRICNFCNVFRRFLAVISFTRLCNSAVWNDFPQYGKRNAFQVPASGTKIVLNILSYFCQLLQWYPILKNVTLIMT